MKLKIKTQRLPQIHIDLERWKYYRPLDVYVSSLGRIKNKQGELQRLTAHNGYLQYNGKYVHRIILEAFNPIPNFANLTVDHLDHNTRNNSLKNLEWVTKQENLERAAADLKQNEIVPIGTRIKLNGIVLPLESVKTILYNDKCMNGNKTGIDRTLTKVLACNNEVKFGNYTLQKYGS